MITFGCRAERINSPVVTRLRSGPLAAWASAWLGGAAAFDDVLTAASVGAAAPALSPAQPRMAGGSGGAGPSLGDGQTAQLGEILIAWRQARAELSLVLPVPGDTRGVAGPASFREAALEAGQAVIGTGPGGAIGVVPVMIDHRPSSAPATLSWKRFDIDPPVRDLVTLADAQYELTEAIRDCASALARLQLTAPAADPALNDELIAARRAGERINLPPGFPPRAVALVAQAERMAAVLTLAGAEVPPANDPDHRAEVLKPLVLAVRRARLAGYNAYGAAGAAGATQQLD
jgi:hypothetical protein